MRQKAKVYVIDDEAAMRDSLEFLLESSGFDVTLFESAQQFLDALPGLPFGCVVSDVRMPGIDGIALLKHMKAADKRFPILIMTVHGDVPLAVEAMKLGAIDFLEKPFEDERLTTMIESAIRQTERAWGWHRTLRTTTVPGRCRLIASASAMGLVPQYATTTPTSLASTDASSSRR